MQNQLFWVRAADDICGLYCAELHLNRSLNNSMDDNLIFPKPIFLSGVLDIPLFELLPLLLWSHDFFKFPLVIFFHSICKFHLIAHKPCREDFHTHLWFHWSFFRKCDRAFRTLECEDTPFRCFLWLPYLQRSIFSLEVQLKFSPWSLPKFQACCWLSGRFHQISAYFLGEYPIFTYQCRSLWTE